MALQYYTCQSSMSIILINDIVYSCCSSFGSPCRSCVFKGLGCLCFRSPVLVRFILPSSGSCSYRLGMGVINALWAWISSTVTCNLPVWAAHYLHVMLKLTISINLRVEKAPSTLKGFMDYTCSWLGLRFLSTRSGWLWLHGSPNGASMVGDTATLHCGHE